MSVAVIGGADGPTAVFVTGNPWAAVITGIIVLAVIVLGVVLWRRKRK